MSIQFQDNPAAEATTERGYAERTTTDTTTNVDYNSAASNKISGLSVTVVGEGLPVMIEFFCAGVSHSTNGRSVNAILLINGVVTNGQIGLAESSSGDLVALILRRRIVLTPGVSYTFEIGKAVAVAGTGSFVALSDAPMHLSVNR